MTDHTLVLATSETDPGIGVHDSKQFEISGSDLSPTAPTTPISFFALISSSSEIDLYWHYIAGDIKHNIYRSTVEGFQANAATLVAAGITTDDYQDVNVSSNTTYYYRVTSVDGVYESLPSEEDFDTTPSAPVAAKFAFVPNATPALSLVKYWQIRAELNAGIDFTRLTPWTGFHGDNVSIAYQVYDDYQRLYELHTGFEWAGMARMAGGPLLRAMEFTGDSANVNAVASALGQVYYGVNTNGFSAYLDKIGEILLTGMKSVFDDMAWEFEAYNSGGLAVLTSVKNSNLIAPNAYTAWSKIDVGLQTGNNDLIWLGTADLAHREQYDVLQQYFGMLGNMVFVPTLMSFMAQNPFHVMGGANFVSLVTQQSFGNLCNANDRWAWVTTQMIPIWQQPGQLVVLANFNRAFFIVQADKELFLDFIFE